MRPIPMVALNDSQVALIYSLVLLAVVQKTGSTADQSGEPRYRDVRDRWLVCTAGELEEVRARLADVWGSRLGEEFVKGATTRFGTPPSRGEPSSLGWIRKLSLTYGSRWQWLLAPHGLVQAIHRTCPI
jgi:hypothetical protein